MPTFAYESGAWQQVLNIYTYHNGEWVLVNGAWKYVDGVWQQYYSNNSFEVAACGLEQTVMPSAERGLWMNGSQLFAGARSYNVVLFDNYGNVTDTTTYDVFGDQGATGSGTATQNLINAIDSWGAGQIYVIFSYDEPSTGAANLASAFSGTLFGGACSTILTSGMAYRGAYLAVGKKGAAPYLEKYCGTETSNVNGTGNVGTADGCLQFQFQMHTTAGPDGVFVNMNTLYQGGTLITNSSELGMGSVAGMATDY